MSADKPDTGSPRLGAPSEEFLATVARALPEAVLVLDASGCISWGNAAAQELFGLSIDAARGRSALDFIYPDDVELVLRSLESVLDKQVGTLIELRVATPKGWTLVEVIGRRVPELGEGQILFCLRDVTERRRFEVARDDVAKFRSIIQHAAVVTMQVSAEGIVESISSAVTRHLGYDPEMVEGRPFQKLFGSEDAASISGALAEAARHGATGTPVTVEATCVHGRDLAEVPVEISIVSLLEDPVVDGYVISMRDVSEQTRVAREMSETLSLLTATLESTADGILVIDTEGRIVSYNRRFAELWKIPEELLRSRDDNKALSFVTEQLVEPGEFLSRVAEIYSTPEAESFDTLHFRDGRVFERYSRPQRVGEEIVGRVASFRDITERKRLEESLAYRASHDALTGLANQSLFLEQLNLVMGSGESELSGAVLFIDVDGLKAVNDRFGHIAGDRLLAQVADVLRSCARAGDTLARLGGDEFGVLVRHSTEQTEVLTLARRILKGLPRNFTVAEEPVEISLSIGIAFNEAGLTGLDVLQYADAAMYRAKQKGRGRWELHGDAHLNEGFRDP